MGWSPTPSAAANALAAEAAQVSLSPASCPTISRNAFGNLVNGQGQLAVLGLKERVQRTEVWAPDIPVVVVRLRWSAYESASNRLSWSAIFARASYDSANSLVDIRAPLPFDGSLQPSHCLAVLHHRPDSVGACSDGAPR